MRDEERALLRAAAQEACHEANVNPWLRAAKAAGATVKWWPLLPDGASNGSNGSSGGNNVAGGSCDVARLVPLLSERTRLVAVTHVSNLLGVLPVAWGGVGRGKR